MLRQRTIRKAVHAIGTGVHSGETVRMTLRPAGENTGILFVRGDAGNATVRACVENVCDTTLSTSLGESGTQVSTVEHLMSALWGLGVDNLIIELSGGEVPIMDGSAAPFVYLINSVGVREQFSRKQFLRVKREITVSEGDAAASLSPFQGFEADYTFVADHPVFNRYPKRARFGHNEGSYLEDVSRARSFGLVKDLEQAQMINRCLGSSLENAVGIGDFEILNEDGLRYEDEFAKHKLLDAIGDLYLMGRPLLAHFRGYKSGHALNHRLAQTLLQNEDAWEIVTLDPDREETPALQPVHQPLAG